MPCTRVSALLTVTSGYWKPSMSGYYRTDVLDIRARDVDGHGHLLLGISEPMAQAILGPEHRWCARAEWTRGRAITRRLVLGDELSSDGHEDGPAGRVRMTAVARARGPDQDARLDAAAGCDRDLHLAFPAFGRERDIARQAASIERPISEQ